MPPAPVPPAPPTAAPAAAPVPSPSGAAPAAAARGDRTGVSLGWAPERQFAVYGQLTTLIVLNSIGASFEYRPIRAFSVSGGLGYGLSVVGQSIAAQVAAHGLFGPPGPHSFEVSVGVAPTYIFDALCFFCGEETPDPRGVILPSAFLGYRYQAMDTSEDGVVLRVGPGWNYGTGIGLDLSLGYAF
jgi:hypothetical protein